jgi:hypothetical protein
MQVQGLFLVRAHFGWANFIARKVSNRIKLTAPFARLINHVLSKRTEARSLAFDLTHKTKTFERGDYPVTEGVHVDERCWGYGPINQDFFREIMRAVPVDLSCYSFVDVGAGKGVALMLASEFSFHHVIGVELSRELIDIGKRNVACYNKSTGAMIDPVWIRADFLTWKIPEEDSLFFFNNPLPKDIALRAVQKIVDDSLKMNTRSIIIYRRPPGKIPRYLAEHHSCCPLRLSPYWQIYEVGL